MPRICPVHFLDALSFFTCLVPARMVRGTALHLCAPWFGACGLVIGLVCTLAAWAALMLCQFVIAAGPVPALILPGLVWLVFEMTVSRGLHWDGLADVFDALGSQRRGDEFRAILKDSRLGTFGALALLAVFVFQLAGAAGHASSGIWAPLILAPVWGRGLAVLVFCLSTPYTTTHSLGGQFAEAGTVSNLALSIAHGAAVLLLLGLAGISPLNLLLLAAGQCLILWRVLSWCRTHGGYSGDFIGCFIELSQAMCLIATL
ncbi:MAG: adenosylcobinamide-GDP ribazoletransferase [Desulfovibrionaceae bacterium]|nr:adenosylcobinamide-GDP ribazoletransferase [Desulfovibrionaceae bacterium]